MLNNHLNIWSPRPNPIDSCDDFFLKEKSLQLGTNELPSRQLKIFHYPVMKIESLPIVTEQLLTLKNISDNALCIFVSQNAVKTAVNQIHQQISDNWFVNHSVLAIGPTTHQALLAYDLAPTHQLEGAFTSEGLLQSKFFSENLADVKNVLVFSGRGGRTYLLNQLSEKHKKVMKIESYQRIKIYIHQSDMLEFLQIRKINAVFLTSCEVIDLVVMQLKQSQVLNRFLNQVVFCMSPRVAKHAKNQGFMNVVVAKHADNQSLIEAAVLWCKNNE